MSRFIKLEEKSNEYIENVASTLYLNVDSIIALHKEKGIVYVQNSGGQDIFFVNEESIDKIIDTIYSED